MKNKPNLIVMLTYNDLTVSDAHEIFLKHKDTCAEYWGFKEEGLPVHDMQALFLCMKEHGKKTVLEVVAYTPEECMHGAEMAVACGVDILMGTVYADEINALCKEHGILYMPFVGKVYERPSVLEGTAEEMIAEANAYIEKGAFGIDLLGYRYTGDAAALNRAVVNGVKGAVCLAGSVNSHARLDEVKETCPWGFTVGSAFFDKQFGEDFGDQINAVCEYIERA